MKSYKSRAFVIQLKQLKEANKLAILWTFENGKSTYLVKGANKILSRKSALLDNLNLIEINAVKTKGEFDLITEVSLVQDYSHLKTNLDNIQSVLYFLEVLNKFLTDNVQQIEFFYWFLKFLEVYSSNIEKSSHALLLFQMHTLVENGFSPELYNCVVCSDKLNEHEERISSENTDLGYICEKHFDNNDTRDKISDTIIKIQRFFVNRSLEESFNLNIKKSDIKRLFFIQNGWIESICEKNLNSKDLLNL